MIATKSTEAKITTSTAPKEPDLGKQLLPLSAMPAGWSVDNSSSDGSSSLGKCKPNPRNGSPRAEVSYVDGASGIPALSETVVWAPATAARELGTFAHALDACKTFTATSDGTKFTGTIGRMNVPKIGGDTEAWQVALSASGLTFGMDVVAFRKGSEDAVLEYMDFGTPDVDVVIALCRKALARL